MTIQEIANELKISVSTVSKALNGASDVSAATRQTVCAYAKKVGYKTKRSLKLKGRLGLLWAKKPEDKFSAASQVADAFRKEAQDNMYLVFSDDLHSVDASFDLNEYMKRQGLDAAIFFDLNFYSPIYKKIKHTERPLVLFDNYISDNALVSGVGCDNIHATEKAIDYLVKKGHKTIGFVGGERQSLVSAERLAGYILGLSKNSIEYRYDITYFGDFERQSGVDAANYFFQNNKEITAVVCASDNMAMGLIDQLRLLGKKIPQDVSIIGFDDLEILRYTNYNLSTIRQDFEAIGQKAFHILDSMLSGQPAQRAILGFKLIERDTVIKLADQNDPLHSPT
ncbi:MAG: LacI family DNA-binding transcriptional regulator [Clostridia bacterium]|nr:LacI family DNA-binding transcriptional regulator [Clostridia bacterium]